MKSYTITVNGNVYDVTVEEKNEAGAASAPAAAPKAAPKAPKAPAPKKTQGAGSIRVEAGAAGKVFKIEASVGQKVKRGEPVVIIEAMKIMNEIKAPCDGKVIRIMAQPGDMVEYNQVLCVIE